VALLVASLLLVPAPFLLYRHWTSKRREYIVASIWFRSIAFQHGRVRATPVRVVWASVFVSSIALMVLPPQTPWALVTLLVVSAFAMPVYWSVVLFNRPKWLVAPHLRDEPGAIEMGRRRAAARRTAVGGTPLASLQVDAEGMVVAIADSKARKVPDWPTDAEPRCVSDGETVLVGVRRPEQGEVLVTVLGEEEPASPHAEIFAGALSLPSGVLEVGNDIAGQVKRVDLRPARTVTVRILIDPLDEPSSVVVVLSRST
jgi:hypothetical protein